MPLPPYVKTVLRRLNEAGYEAYVVGGAVRSWLLNRPIHDYDITTNALPEQTREVFSDRKIVDIGIRHGTVTIVDHKNTVEVTTYRTESGYTDHRHPDHVEYTGSVKEDCARRDFTVNALCYNPKEGVLDFFEGRKDLENRLIRAVNDPLERFDEDALRILRALRFAAQLEFAVEGKTKAALLDKAEGLGYVSQERITGELIKTFEAPGFPPILKEFPEIFELLIPELREYDEAYRRRIEDMIDHSPDNAVVRMALLLSGLDDVSRSDEILRRLKYSNADRYAVTNLLACAKMPAETRIDMRRILNKLTVPEEQFIGFRCALDPSVDQERLSSLCAAIRKDGDCYSLKQLEVTGKDLKELGLKGSRISMSINACLNAVIEEQVPNTREDLMNYLRKLTG